MQKLRLRKQQPIFIIKVKGYDMSEQRIKTIDFDEFQVVTEEFIERSSQEFGEMPASAFFELLFEKMVERVTETVEIEVEEANA